MNKTEDRIERVSLKSGLRLNRSKEYLIFVDRSCTFPEDFQLMQDIKNDKRILKSNMYMEGLMKTLRKYS